MTAQEARGRRILLSLTAAALALGVGGYLLATRPIEAPALPTARDPAPSFELAPLDGQKLQLSTLRGQIVLVDFWATWCGPCRDEAPKLVELQHKYAARGLRVIGISMDDDAAPVRTFYAQHRLNYPVALGDAALAERFGRVLGMPAKFLIDRQGRIASKHAGAVDFGLLERELQELLSE